MEHQAPTESASGGIPPPWLDGSAFPALSETTISHICAAVAKHGYCRLDNAVSPAYVEQALERARTAVQANGGEYLTLSGPSGVSWADANLLSDIRADSLSTMLARIYASMVGAPAVDDEIYQALRCIQGITGLSHARYVHFDSHAVTLVIPLTPPHADGGGDLVLLSARRSIPRSYLINILTKLILDLPPVQKLLWYAIARGRLAATRLRMAPGAAYIFSGCRTLHTNDRTPPELLRATLVYHYGNPHAGMRSRILLSRLRGKRSRRISVGRWQEEH